MRAAELNKQSYFDKTIGFYYNGTLYIRLIPSKNLFRSTMVHEVVNRMDVFAMDVATQQFTIIKGTAEVEPVQLAVGVTSELSASGKHTPTPPPDSMKALVERMKQQDLEL